MLTEKNAAEKNAAEMSDREALRLIFAPGFSTNEKVSDLSGRGVGMDVVRSNIEKIGGTVDIESTLGQGSRIRLKLPLTLAIMPALVIESEDRVFAVPQVDIEELLRIRKKDTAERIERIQGKPVMRLREKILPLVCLNELLGIEGDSFDSIGELKSDQLNAFNMVVLRVGPNRFGLIVKKLRDSEEIVVKPLPEYLKNCRTYAGTTIMGDGRVAMILDAAGMAEDAQLRIADLQDKADLDQDAQSLRESMKEKQSLLLFRNGTSERFAINLAMVKRIEKIKWSTIEQVKDKEYLKYQNSSLRLVRLHDVLPVQSPAKESDACFVIVPKLVKYPMGIIVSAVEDVLETNAPLDVETVKGTGILGSFVVDGNLIIDLDVYSLFEAAEPDIYCADQGGGLRGKRVLLAEDTAFFRSIESNYLEEIGCDVEVVEDGE